MLSDQDGGLEFWQAHRAAYDALDDLELIEPERRVVSGQNGRLSFSLTMPSSSVSLVMLAK